MTLRRASECAATAFTLIGASTLAVATKCGAFVQHKLAFWVLVCSVVLEIPLVYKLWMHPRAKQDVAELLESSEVSDEFLESLRIYDGYFTVFSMWETICVGQWLYQVYRNGDLNMSYFKNLTWRGYFDLYVPIMAVTIFPLIWWNLHRKAAKAQLGPNNENTKKFSC